MKKKMLILCLLMAALLLTGCGGDNATTIEGVWRLDDTEYEFSHGLGRRIEYKDGEVCGAEGFTYTMNDGTVTLALEEGAEQEYTWSARGKKLTLSDRSAKLKLTAVTRKSVPYLPDGYIAPLSVTKSFDGKQIELSDFETAQLLQLLRSGEVTEQGTAQPEELDEHIGYYIVEGDGFDFKVVDGVLWVADGDMMKTFELSNVWVIKGFFGDLEWSKAFPKTLESGKFVPTAIYSVTRVSEGEKQALFMTKEDGEKLAALASQGDAIGLFDGVYRDTYYEIQFLTETDKSPIVRIYPDGILRMDSVVYELREAEEIIRMLDALGNELYITQQSVVLTECTDEPGELIYVNLEGVPNGGSAKWRSSNRSVCTVEGNEHHAKIFMRGVGEAVVTVESRVNGETKSAALKVTVVEDNGYNLQIIPEDRKAAENVARRDKAAWTQEDWCISMNVLESVVDKKETLRQQENYVHHKDGWTEEYLKENFIAVRVTYHCEIDHSKIWYEDGTVTMYTYLTRENPESPWEVWDYGYA